MRTWIFAVVVALMFAINLGLVSLRIAQTGEETVRARVALATSALKGQLELIDARLSPRAVGTSPDLIDATRPPVDPTQPLGKPDERALRAAAAALSPEPDLLIVASAQGAMISRRSKPAQSVDDPSALPLVKSGLEGNPSATFAALDGALYRVAVARIPGNAAVVVVGMLVDDRMAAQLRSQVDADVTLLQAGKPLASSLAAEDRARVARWAAAPAPGYGVLQVHLPVIGTALSGRLPRGATRYAVRGALVSLGAGVQAAVTVPASPYLGWLARYQAFYLLALLGFVLLSFVWGLLARAPAPVVVAAAPAPTPAPAPAPPRAPRQRPTPAPALEAPGPQPSLDVGNPVAPAAPPAPRDVPWREGEGPSGEYVAPPPLPPPEPLDPEVLPEAGAPGAARAALAAVPLPDAHGARVRPSLWSDDPLAPTPVPELVAEPVPEPRGAATVPSPAPGLDEPPGNTFLFAAPRAAPPAARSDFSFAGLLDEAREPEAGLPPPPPLSRDLPETTAPGLPTDALLAQSKPDYGALGVATHAEPDYFPGDEPTRIEPVSAALLDKLREKDEPEAVEALPESAFGEAAAPAPGGDVFAMLHGDERAPAAASPTDELIHPGPDPFEAGPSGDAHQPSLANDTIETAPVSADAQPPEGDAGHEHAGHEHAEAHEQGRSEAAASEGEPAAEPPHEHAHEHTEPDAAAAQPPDAAPEEPPAEEPQPGHAAAPFELAPEAGAELDPDEPHWRETFDHFRELKSQLGEPADRISFEKFAAKLRKNRADLMAKHSCKGVRFVVYEKDRKAAIKASAVR